MGVKIVKIDIDKLKEPVNEFPEHSIIIVKEKDKILVLDNTCTHLGCKVKYIKEKNYYQCPCHKSIFNIYGKVIKGPAKKDLKRLSFKIVNEKIIIKEFS